MEFAEYAGVCVATLESDHRKMNCPEVVADSVLEILSYGILAARNLGGTRASIEADHLHNLPDLLKEYKSSKLGYYLDVEISCYVDKVGYDHPFEQHWKILRDYVNRSIDPSMP